MDNIWNSQNPVQKTKALRALSQYMHSIQKKPLSKNFSHYVIIIQGYQCGVFVKWSSVLKAIEAHPWLVCKGFYSLDEALQHAREKLGHNFYVEEGQKDDDNFAAANFFLENQNKEEEVKQMIRRNVELALQLTG